jgi:sarcosine oxidase
VTTWDVAVVGLGAMGSAVAAACSARGASVLGFDAFDPPHALGSSHGETRITREAYFEDPCYVPLVKRANALWRELERESGERLLVDTGGLVIGRPDGVLVPGALASAVEHGLPHERLTAAEVRRRFPAFAPADGLEAVWEPNAGVLFPERCVAAQLARARARGATLRPNTPVTGWEAEGPGFIVRAGDQAHRAARLVLAANAWLPRLLPDTPLPVTVSRQPLFWFQPERDVAELAPDRLPVHIWEPDAGAMFYGFPAFGGTVKIAIHGGGAPSDPDHVERTVTDEEVDVIRRRIAPYLPGMAGLLARTAVCMYVNTPDGHFVVDRHPAHARALVISACSGHGFKFSIAIGEAAADLLLDERPRPDLAPFRWRWGAANSSTLATPT